MAKKVKFTLSNTIASNAALVQLLGDFNNWDIKNAKSLKKDKSGNFTADLLLEPGVYKYRYLLDSIQWVNDESGSYEFDTNIGEYNCIVSIEADVTKEAKPAASKKEAKPKAAKAEEIPAATPEKEAPKDKEKAPKAPKPKSAKPKVEEPVPVTPVEEPVKKTVKKAKAAKSK